MTFDYSKDELVIWANVSIALLFLPAYMYLGEAFKYIIFPYIIYMVLSKDPRYFPALIVHIIPGSTISNLILLLSLFLAVFNWVYLIESRSRWLFFLSILPLPIFIGHIFLKIVYLNFGFIEIISSLSFYLGLFPFFYGVIIAKKVNIQIWKSIMLVLFLLHLIMFIPNLGLKIRYFWFSFPLFMVIIFLSLRSQFKKKLNSSIIWISCIFFLLIFLLKISALKFTLLFSGIISCGILLLYFFQFKLMLAWLTKPRVLILTVFLTIIVISSSSSYEAKGNNFKGLSLFEMESPLDYLIYKALGDRGVLWSGGWDFLVEEELLWPPDKVPTYSYVTSTGAYMDDINFGIHNLGLELIRNYGFIIGGLIIVVYTLMITRSGRIFSLNKQNIYVLIFGSTVIGTGIVGAMVGQFPLMNTFSFLFMGISGMVYGKSLISNYEIE